MDTFQNAIWLEGIGSMRSRARAITTAVASVTMLKVHLLVSLLKRASFLFSDLAEFDIEGGARHAEFLEDQGFEFFGRVHHHVVGDQIDDGLEREHSGTAERFLDLFAGSRSVLTMMGASIG